MTVWESLRSAAALAIQGQNETVMAAGEVTDDNHRVVLIKVSGLFNQLAQEVFRELERLEPDDDEDGS